MSTIYDLLLRARTIVELCAIKNPKFKYEGVLQDPYGAHQLLLEINDALQARVAELEKDAARYRWLKLQRRSMLGPNVMSGPRSEHVGNLDAVIDTAIAASKEAPNKTLPQGEEEPKPAFSKDALWGMEHLRAELRAKVEALLESGPEDEPEMVLRSDVLEIFHKAGGGV